MRVITARNVHQALPLGLRLLAQEGAERGSRYGNVVVAPFPVTTVYEKPMERVLFWKARDANPFFHLYESLWMLAGRRDVKGVAKYAKRMETFSDDGQTFHGAYGYRWKNHFTDLGALGQNYGKLDQLWPIGHALETNPDDRRCVLQMWDPTADLAKEGKDFPCNVTATFQRDAFGRLDLTVFCRSNDIIWGAYGANAVHFSMLLEYMATWMGCPVGVYRQISVNWHAYTDVLHTVDGLWNNAIDRMDYVADPYAQRLAEPIPMWKDIRDLAVEQKDTSMNRRARLDHLITKILEAADANALQTAARPSSTLFPWSYNVWKVLEAHEAFREKTDSDRFAKAATILSEADPMCDWVRAAKEWLFRRALKLGIRPGSLGE